MTALHAGELLACGTCVRVPELDATGLRRRSAYEGLTPRSSNAGTAMWASSETFPPESTDALNPYK